MNSSPLRSLEYAVVLHGEYQLLYFHASEAGAFTARRSDYVILKAIVLIVSKF